MKHNSDRNDFGNDDLNLEDDNLSEVPLSNEEKLQLFKKQDEYSNLLNEREKATFAMMMRMNPEALEKIRKEFFAREDETSIEDFIYIFQRHLVNKEDDDILVMETPEQREFVTCMFEMFKNMDINGDGGCEWQEFTTFTVEKANLLNKRAKLTNIAHYHDTTHSLDPSAHYRHRHEISRFVNIPSLSQFAMLEDHKSSIFLFNSRTGKNIANINTETAPIAIEAVKEKDKVMLVTSGADMTLSTYSLDDPNPKRKHKLLTSWTSPGVQMALVYAPENKVLYSGATNGNIYSWNIQKRSLVSTLTGHQDIVMKLNILQKLDNIASASLDKTVAVWDSHTNERLLKLEGHKKGVFDLTYNPSYRLMVSCGFEHDACVWSPFVKSLVYRLKGHHASLIGCQSVDNSPEVITADTSGVFKLWDVRNFQCVQTFSVKELKSGARMSCFLHTKLPSNNAMQKEDDSRMFAASKNLFSFDQARVVHEATTDYTNVTWLEWIEESCTIISASKSNAIVWDALIGSKKFTHTDINPDEITACLLDDRKRKILIGDVRGIVRVYNSANGQLMKTSSYDNPSTVVSLAYYDEAKRYLAGYANGIVGIFDENDMEDCLLIRTLESYNQHPLLHSMVFDQERKTIATVGGSTCILRLWDYETGKCFNEMKASPNNDAIVLHASFLFPYPLLITGDSEGNFIIWGSKGSGSWEGRKIAGFTNLNPDSAHLEPVTKNKDEKEEEPPRRVLPQRIPNNNNEKLLKSSNRIDHKTNLTQSIKLIENSVEKWGKSCAAEGVSWEADTELLFIGDDMGSLRCYSLKNMFDDLQRETLLDETSYDKEDHDTTDTNTASTHNTSNTYKCRSVQRNDQSAVPPTPLDINSSTYNPVNDKYVLESKYNPMSYLGIDFMWMIPAHYDRIICCKSIKSKGVLTSAADRLVKMWDFKGRPLGTLLQSVPVGMRSRTWKLVIDIDPYMKKEREDLNELIANVQEVANSDEKPDIRKMNFAGLELGDESAAFSQSMLRQRIDKSTKILGIDFSNHNNKIKGNDGDEGDDIFSVDQSVQSYTSRVSKTHGDAIKDMKSPEGAIRKDSNRKLTDAQQKRRDQRLESLHNIYKEKSGLKVKTGSITSEYSEEKLNMDLNPDDSSVDDRYSVASSVKYNNRISKPSGRKEALSKIEESMKFVKENGTRTLNMLNTCRRYSTYNTLENMISGDHKEHISDDMREVIRRKSALRRESLYHSASSIGLKIPSRPSTVPVAGLTNTNTTLTILETNENSISIDSTTNKQISSISQIMEDDKMSVMTDDK